MSDYVTLETLMCDSVAKKHLPKAGYSHSIAVAESAYELAVERGVCVDLATKAGLLHDIGHTVWENQGEWDYKSYREYDIHTIKGAERAHELLTLKGEDLGKAREIALAILFHSDSSQVSANVELTDLQRLIADADNMNKEKDGAHHTQEVSFNEVLQRIRRLDMLVYRYIKKQQQCEECRFEQECTLK
ncbi:MAG: HD domain-containing protein [Bacillota bacterium]